MGLQTSARGLKAKTPPSCKRSERIAPTTTVSDTEYRSTILKNYVWRVCWIWNQMGKERRL